MSSIEALVDDIRHGKMIILMDSHDRENEADIVMAAEKVTPEDINFMITHARGMICVPMAPSRCKALELDLQPRRHCDPCCPKFTVSIEAVSGVTTGVSAHDRAHTIQLAADLSVGADAIATPGHIFPIMAEEEGVLTRQGHTEGAYDLVRLAGLSPVAIVCEITRDDGQMSRLKDVEAFAETHNLQIGFIEDLIEFRKHHKKGEL
jgi:3,4-dihydroxy 2-butanone 4-phosphate synthase/GTP cyclohydrolase II